MSAALERIIEEVRQLPPDEKRRLRDALDRELATPAPYQKRQREQQWVETHRDEYEGQWVAVEGEEMIAHGHDARAVYEAARAAGISVPYVVRVEKRAEAQMGGWL